MCAVCLLLCIKEECSSPVSLQLLREGICAIVYIFVGFWDGDNVRQLPYVWYYVLVKSCFKHTRNTVYLSGSYRQSKHAYVVVRPGLVIVVVYPFQPSSLLIQVPRV